MADEEKALRGAVKNARSAFYKNKGKDKKLRRKDVRKNKRQERKVKQQKYMMKKYNQSAENMVEPEEKKKPKKKKKRKKKQPDDTQQDDEEKEFDYKQYAYEAANEQDERIIASLGKKLKANKQTKVSNVFKEDGLDYLLEVCEPMTHDGMADDSDEEYLEKKKLKSTLNKTKQKESKSYKESEVHEKLLFDDEHNEDDDGDEEDEEDFDDDEDEEMYSESNEDDIDYNSNDEIGVDNDDDGHDSVIDNGKRKDEDSLVEVSAVKYIPPALRKLKQSDEDKEKIKQERLKKQLKGLMNRLSASTIVYITNELENMYSNNSRNVINELLYSLVFESLVTESLMSERLIAEHMIVITALQNVTGSEIGSYFLQMLVERFDKIHNKADNSYVYGKQCQNILIMLSYLYILKVVGCLLIYDLIRRLIHNFTEQDVEMILLLLKTCGNDIRRDDPSALKDFILEVQTKAITSELKDQSRVRFMFDTITALKNNNLRKLQQHDGTIVEDSRKLLKVITKGKDSTSNAQLNVSLEDLLNAKEKGKWWVIGSAWTGRGPSTHQEVEKKPEENIVSKNSKLLDIAKKQRMNTNLRKDIFCAMMTSEDYIDAFERLLKLNLKEKPSREILHVLLDCCLQEKIYNPFYAHLADKLCEFSHSNQVTLQYSFWDRFKTISSMSKGSAINMATLLAHLIASKSLSLAALKVVSFGVLDKRSIRFFINFFKTLLLQYPENVSKAAFQRVSTNEKLSLLREGIKIFLRHFLTPKQCEERTEDMKMKIQNDNVLRLVEIAESALEGREYVPL